MCQHWRHCLCSKRHSENELGLLVFPWVNFNAVYIVRTATTISMCLLILVEICCEMTILRQVEIVIFCHRNATPTVWLLPKYKAHIKGFPICTSKGSRHG